MSESVTPEVPAKKTSGLAIAGLVLGILAALGSFLPIINNLSFILAVVGLVLAIIALVGALKGKHDSKGLAIAGVALCAVSCVVVLVTQKAYGDALKKASTGSEPVAVSSTNSPAAQSSSAGQAASSAEATNSAEAPKQEQKQDYSNLAVGSSVQLDDGLTVTVNSVDKGLKSYSDKTIVGVNVTYTNNGQKSASFNTFDWKGEDANGAQRSTTFYGDSQDALSSGKLSPGGSATGNLYFEDGTVRVCYYNNVFNDSPTAAWNL